MARTLERAPGGDELGYREVGQADERPKRASGNFRVVGNGERRQLSWPHQDAVAPRRRATCQPNVSNTWTASPPEDGRTVLAVFSSSDVLTGPANLHRIPGAIDLVDFLEYPSPPTFHGGLPTDIDEDFAIHDSSMSVGRPP